MEIPVLLLTLIIVAVIIVLLSSVRFIPNNRVGIVEKRFSGKGSVKEGLIALSNEAGYQPNVLRGGIRLLAPFQYNVHLAPLVTIPQGQIGYVFARDGSPLHPTQTLAQVVPEGKTFQDVEGFLKHGGQRGPQRQFLREGTYAINPAHFVIFTESRHYSLPLGREEEANFKGNPTLTRERNRFHPIATKRPDAPGRAGAT